MGTMGGGFKSNGGYTLGFQYRSEGLVVYIGTAADVMTNFDDHWIHDCASKVTIPRAEDNIYNVGLTVKDSIATVYINGEAVISDYNVGDIEGYLSFCNGIVTGSYFDDIVINGSVKQLCVAAAAACRELGYAPVMLTDQLCCQAKEAGSFLASVLKTHTGSGKNLAFLAGGETVVHLTGKGKGGRNQELALAAAVGIDGISGTAVFSVGSDGTDGPTDAAGGYVDYTVAAELKAQGVEIFDVLQQNDAYHALQKVGGLVMTGPTGTNVNDVAVVLLGKGA